MSTEKFKLAENILMVFEIGPWFDPNDPDYISGNVSTPKGKKMCGWTVDTGGETKYGVAQKSWPKISVRDLNAADAEELYYDEYWIPSKCESLPEKTSICYYDAVVNMGLGQAGKLLQRIVGAKDDGQVGNKTIECVNNSLKTKSDIELAKAYQQKRLDFYKLIAHDKDDPTTPKNEDVHGIYENGWTIRVNKLSKMLGLL